MTSAYIKYKFRTELKTKSNKILFIRISFKYEFILLK